MRSPRRRSDRVLKPRRVRRSRMWLLRSTLAGTVAASAFVLGACQDLAAQEMEPAAFLEAMEGEWSVEAEGVRGPGQDPVRTESRESARLLDGQWLVAEADAMTAEGRPYTSMWILGWDPHEEHFVGTWVASIQTHKWRFTGHLDESGTVLTLETEGPFMGDPANTTGYREILEVVSRDHRVIRSLILGPDGEWFQFARAEYRRVR